MKVSVSLPEDDVEFLDAYAATCGLPSRSAAMHKAVGLLKSLDLASAYEEAWREWAASGEAGVWESTVADGIAT
jgi:Arc/MetJ-type ribon-helix-helix transcriptional regulator